MVWKWGIFFYEISLTFEIIITLFFWAVLFPLMKSKSAWTFIDHISPILILTIDYCLNRIPFSLRHLPLSMGILLIYGIVNMTYTLVTHKPIYPPLNFHDFMSFVWAVVLVGLEAAGFLGMYHLTQWKLRKVNK